jgi:hypothetical protein
LCTVEEHKVPYKKWVDSLWQGEPWLKLPDIDRKILDVSPSY